MPEQVAWNCTRPDGRLIDTVRQGAELRLLFARSIWYVASVHGLLAERV
ncbi:MAG: hypothetical protein HXY37_01070 [Chloroflexi bacterium]|nr:hypothetical protein [Chloroflexota bacterium]